LRNRSISARNQYPGWSTEISSLPIEAFELDELEAGITKNQIDALKELTWIAANQNLFFMGPPGLGKTMLAVGLGLKAIDAGYSVCYERMVNLVDILDNAPYQKIPKYRLAKLKKSQVIIIDEIGYTPITREEANRFFSFISELYERSSLIFTTNKRIDEWAQGRYAQKLWMGKDTDVHF
jgi:DNA replication protein DnaC